MYSVETGEWEQWEDLSQNLWGHSCTRVDNLVVVAGGVNPAFAMVATTFILDLDTRQQRVVGDLQADMQAVFNDDQIVEYKIQRFFKSIVCPNFMWRKLVFRSFKCESGLHGGGVNMCLLQFVKHRPHVCYRAARAAPGSAWPRWTAACWRTAA